MDSVVAVPVTAFQSLDKVFHVLVYYLIVQETGPSTCFYQQHKYVLRSPGAFLRRVSRTNLVSYLSFLPFPMILISVSVHSPQSLSADLATAVTDGVGVGGALHMYQEFLSQLIFSSWPFFLRCASVLRLVLPGARTAGKYKRGEVNWRGPDVKRYIQWDKKWIH